VSQLGTFAWWLCARVHIPSTQSNHVRVCLRLLVLDSSMMWYNSCLPILKDSWSLVAFRSLQAVKRWLAKVGASGSRKRSICWEWGHSPKVNFLKVFEVLWKLMKVLGEVYFKWVSVSGNAPEWRGCFHFRLQLKSTLVDRIIRDRSLIPPDHFIISQSHRLGTRHLQINHTSPRLRDNLASRIRSRQRCC